MSRVPVLLKTPAVKGARNALETSPKTHEFVGKRLCLSVSSWFCVPELGMTQLEILCRASGFIVKSNGTKVNKFKPKYHFVTVSHTLAPWKWPKLFPESFLKHVNEKHVTYTADIRHPDGTYLGSADLKHNVYHHESRNLSVLHLDDEEKDVTMFDDFDIHMDLKLSKHNEDDGTLKEGLPLEFHGHVIPPAVLTDLKDVRPIIPKVVKGFMLPERSALQVFVKTDITLANCMCGGPVVLLSSEQAKNTVNTFIDGKDVTIAGMTEGIIPTDAAYEPIRGAATFIEAPVIRKFLTDVEEGRITPEVGGDIWMTVGRNITPENCDMSEILQGTFGDDSGAWMDPKTGRKLTPEEVENKHKMRDDLRVKRQ